MPTIHTEDPVGKAIEDHYYGTQCVHTGSMPNQIGLNEYGRRQSLQRATGVGGAYPRGSGSHSYSMLPLFQNLMEAIPKWLYVILVVTGGISSYAALGTTLSGTAAGPYVAVSLGGIAGWLILPLIIVLADFAVQLVWLLAKLAFFIGAGAAIIWMIVRLIN